MSKAIAIPQAKPKAKIIEKYFPGVRVQKDIRKYQSSTELLLGKKAFKKLLLDVSLSLTKDNSLKWSKLAVEAMQHSAEDFLVGLFEDSNLCSLHAKRVTLLVKDMQLARRIRGRFEKLVNIVQK